MPRFMSRKYDEQRKLEMCVCFTSMLVIISLMNYDYDILFIYYVKKKK